ncbi:MAG TPA: EAL domain-containing protein [Gammaproteobacteria bacterium]
MQAGSVWTSLRTRLLVIVFLCVLPAFVAFVITGLIDRRHALTASQQRVLALANLKAGYYSEFTAQVHTALNVLTAIPVINALNRKRCSMAFNLLLAHNPRFSNVGMATPDGAVICSGVPIDPHVDMRQRDTIRRVLISQEFVVGYYPRGEVVNEPIVCFAAPVLDEHSHRLKAVIWATVSARWFASLNSASALPGQHAFYLLGDNNQVLFAAPALPPAGEHFFVQSHFKSLQSGSGDGTIVAAGPDGQRYVYGSAALHMGENAAPLVAVVGVPAADVFELSNQALYRNLIVIAVLALLFLVIAWIGTDVLILRRVRALLNAARRIAGGEFSARARVTGSGEISLLGAEFDRMAEALQQRQSETAEHVAHIERLTRLYRVLSSINSVLLHVKDREELLREACRVLVEIGGLRFAWAGSVNFETDEIKPLAHAGTGADYLKQLKLSTLAEPPEGRGIAGQAIRNGSFAITNDIEADPNMAYWRDAARLYGYLSAGGFALHTAGEVTGVLTVYSGDRNFFNGDDVRLIREVAGDISHGLEHIAKSEQAEFLANFDTLTELPNKRYFLDRLDDAVERARDDNRVVAVAMIQLTDLDRINDTLGYNAGDQVIGAAVKNLRDHCEPGDTLARVGGQTFGLLMEDIDALEDIPARIGRVMQDFPMTLHIDGKEVMAHLNAGVAMFPSDTDSATGLFRQAELVLHATSRESGTPYRFYSQDLDKQAAERYAMEAALARAIEHGELALHYQPVVDIKTRKIVSMEALMRWSNPLLGDIRPDVFIPVAEENGGIIALGYWAMQEACRQMHQWKRHGKRGLTIAVNVSVHQLHDTDFPERTQALIAECGAEGEPLLSLEITESQLMGNPREIAEMLARLRQLGIRIAIDDFGTGYSSLSYLNQLRVDVLKIDRSFVLELGRDPGALIVARGIVGIAHNLGVKVVAEGVETEQQLEMLRELGCEYAQGYLFSPPVSGDRAEAFLPDA